MSQKHALIAGATGLIGNELLQLLIRGRHYQKISILSRRKVETSSKRVTTIITDYSKLSDDDIPDTVTDVFCCLGTTMKKAGSKEAFREVDYDYPLKIAEITRQKGAQQYLLVSAMGADAKSAIFYNQVKGETEQAIIKLKFSAFHVFRPSLLMGERDEQRTGEKVAQIVMGSISPLMIGALGKYRPIEGKDVASAMYRMAKKELEGRYIFESDKIQVLADYEASES
ncbi:oxidoreductase [Tunicatimonas pelagia]|uniref:oxidoreductase n=1 Tax=Tunicatimonas pelagia TaxID=931531 RepID=UPI0026667063|nr:oxidoreductase [Tunicatimonas pelagia]WKN45971.1 oxidoreductase [Tunicatimonas pelagia]